MPNHSHSHQHPSDADLRALAQRSAQWRRDDAAIDWSTLCRHEQDNEAARLRAARAELEALKRRSARMRASARHNIKSAIQIFAAAAVLAGASLIIGAFPSNETGGLVGSLTSNGASVVVSGARVVAGIVGLGALAALLTGALDWRQAGRIDIYMSTSDPRPWNIRPPAPVLYGVVAELEPSGAVAAVVTRTGPALSPYRTGATRRETHRILLDDDDYETVAAWFHGIASQLQGLQEEAAVPYRRQLDAAGFSWDNDRGQWSWSAEPDDAVARRERNRAIVDALNREAMHQTSWLTPA